MHLIIFCDGTWNTPEQTDGGISVPTNVVKMRNALEKTDKEGLEQRAYYHPGVGTKGGAIRRIIDGIVGDGLDKNIMSAYCWLAKNYQVGATIWLFGFSRGAFTVRSLGGMISHCGLLDLRSHPLSEKETWSAVQDVFNCYRAQKTVIASEERAFHYVTPGQSCSHTVPINFIGVWDTVGALGIPEDVAFLSLLNGSSRYKFHDTSLSPMVKTARHAISIDEKRQTFMPTLWTGVDPTRDVKQIWFPGVHADVGGGYVQHGLSDGALRWMIEQAEAEGLRFRETSLAQIVPDSLDQQHDSAIGVFKDLKTRPRNVPFFSDENPSLHQSALDRHRNPPLTQRDYWQGQALKKEQSIGVEVFAHEFWNFTGFYLQAGVTYEFHATGEWLDGHINCGPKGTRDGKFHFGKIPQALSSLLGKFELLYSKMTGNYQADFWLTKREESIGWFVLTGMVANDYLPDATPKHKNDFLPHEVFYIGERQVFTPKASGYLYAFANDAWQAYGNNRGSVKLTVSRR
jgi:hypothetical protein